MRKNIPSKAQVRSWRITPPGTTGSDSDRPEPVPAAPAAPTELRHGYTLDDLDRIARTAVALNVKWWSAGDRWQQADIARSGAVEHLYAAETAPAEKDLVYAARIALSDEVNGYKQMHGISHKGGTAPQFAKYWHHVGDEPWEDRLVERIALSQILSRLTEAQREAVTAFAGAGNYAAAAEALGIELRALRSRLHNARTAFAAHWYAPETPGRRKADKRVGSYARPRRTHCHRCLDSHELTDENTYTFPNGSRTCKVHHRALVARRDAAVAAVRRRGASDAS